MSSTKSATGHLLGAAGGVEAAFACLAIRDQIAPPTMNLDDPSVETKIDLVPHKAKAMEINVALSNSFGFLHVGQRGAVDGRNDQDLRGLGHHVLDLRELVRDVVVGVHCRSVL